MNIAVFLGSNLQAGGGFQYEVTVANILKNVPDNTFTFIFITNNKKTYTSFKEIGIETTLLRESLFQKIYRIFIKNLSIYNLLKKYNLHLTNIDRTLNRMNIDLVYFISSNPICLDLSLHNYITTVWDLCHRDYVEFPEVSKYKEFEIREQFYVNSLVKAVAILAESELGKENICRRYGIDSCRVHVLPLLYSEQVQKNDKNFPNSFLDIKKKYSITSDYIFYPAQFWSHKNHIYILNTIKLLKEKYNTEIAAVFSGSDMGNLTYILEKAKEYDIEKQIFYLGFVASEEIPYLYQQALALVMPTYFGPSNIPPLEAFALECPVCYSDLIGLREQVGDAAFLMDLNNPDSLVKNLNEIKNNKPLRDEKIDKGKIILHNWTEKDFWQSLKIIFEDYRTKRACWK
ncbi:MAG: glycosyltransferase family 1 protein [Sulfuricurvum sp.]|jgi:glycosyltransferase involved in cell wall biosynthesis